MINFDNAATTGRKPEMVMNAVYNAMRRLSANPGRGGHRLSLDTAKAVYSTREKIADFFGASGPDRVVFTSNCTTAINYVLKGFLNHGDRVTTSDLEHNAVMRPLKKIGAKVSIATVDFTNDDKTVESFEKLMYEDTKMVFCTAASNVCGKMLPIKKIGGLCKKRGIAFGVDAAQMAGVAPLDMKDMNIDFLCIAPHKGLYAPMGLGVLIAEKEIGDTIIEGGTGTNSLSLYQPQDLPERYESGTLNVPAIMGTSAGIDFVKRYAKDAYNEEFKLIKRLYEELEKMSDIILYIPYVKEGMYMPVLSFNIAGIPSEQTALYLDRKGVAARAGLHCAPYAHRRLGTIDTGTVRIAPSYFSTSAEIDYLIKILKVYK
ncbi:MAG: aminotransferase class V-fold PLP-dependent enzyme [Clostridia bacterium]|nr:aminotransferase class V-fold PLP-dependent enzyme [Clostridia bacterium]